MSTQIASVKQYCNSLVAYSRRKTIEVRIGNLPMGGENPIRIQSMTTVDTMDTKGSVEQAIRMVEAGCEYVRITAPSMKEAQNLEAIKKELRSRGYQVPLIADIHFTPNAAELAARIVEKVRINPGNYADKKRFEEIEYTDASYEAELDRIRQKFTPLVRICKEYGTAMRIGTNHGSLSDRIMSRYGDTPLGMVESALEFLRICEDFQYYDVVLSMKSSNPQVMVQAYRLLVRKLDEEGLKPYPLHLGVTEAGDGEDGRIKSSVGIGTLLEDGLGDTIRVSLTEEPEAEVPVAIALARRYDNRAGHEPIPAISHYPIDPFSYSRRSTQEVLNLGGHQVPRVMADFSRKDKITPASLFAVGYQYSQALDKWNITDLACDYIYAGKNTIGFELPGTLGTVYDHAVWIKQGNRDQTFPFITYTEFMDG
ncbi:MAG TPA: (E)-4-hydroxy-3-methylbut-2-enyl-diphosphate synthase, partial [Chryseosolibacter sp.]